MKDKEYITSLELAQLFSISIKTVTNNSHKIIGRRKIGGAVRYHLPTIECALRQGKNLFSGGKQ